MERLGQYALLEYLLEFCLKFSENAQELYAILGAPKSARIDLEKVQSLFPQVITKLQQYNEHNYDQLITFLGSEEVSKIDPRANDLPNDLVNLVFAIGLTEGHMIYHSAET